MNPILNFQFFAMLDNSSWLQPLLQKYPALNFAGWICRKIYHLFFLPHCFLPFPLLKHRKYLPVMANTYFGVFAFFGSWFVWKHVAKLVLAPKRKSEQPPAPEVVKKQEWRTRCARTCLKNSLEFVNVPMSWEDDPRWWLKLKKNQFLKKENL